MAKKVEMYACDHFMYTCGARCKTWRTKKSAVRTQNHCLLNPDLKGCHSCANFSFNVDLDKNKRIRKCEAGRDAMYEREFGKHNVITNRVYTMCEDYTPKYDLSEISDLTNIEEQKKLPF